MKNGMACVCGFALATFLTGCQTADRTTAAQTGGAWTDGQVPTEGWVVGRYVYHPNAKVYYQPSTQRYYWFEAGAWRAGDTLPPDVEQMIDPRIARIMPQSEPLPFMHHESTSNTYPANRMIPEYYDPDAFSSVAGDTMWE